MTTRTQPRKVSIDGIDHLVDAYAEQQHLSISAAARFLILRGLRAEQEAGNYTELKGDNQHDV